MQVDDPQLETSTENDDRRGFDPVVFSWPSVQYGSNYRSHL